MTAPSRNAILVIDPDLAIRALIVAVLRRKGYVAEVANDLDDALRLHRTTRPRAVVVDPRSPVGDAVLHALQAEGDGATLSPNVIVVTRPDDSNESYAGRPGIHSVLFKPFFLNDLARAVAACCNRA